MTQPLVTHTMRVGDMCDRFSARGFVLLEIRRREIVLCARQPGVLDSDVRAAYQAMRAARRRRHKKRLDGEGETG